MSAGLLVTLLSLLGCLPCLHTHLSTSASIVGNMTMSDPEDCDIVKCPVKACTRAFFSEEKSLCVFLHCPNNASCEHLLVNTGTRVARQDSHGEEGVIPATPDSSPSPAASDLPPGSARAAQQHPPPSNASSASQRPEQTNSTHNSSVDGVGVPKKNSSTKPETTSSASSQVSADGARGNKSTPTSAPAVPHTTLSTANATRLTTITTTTNATTTNATTTNATTVITITMTTNAMTTTTPPLMSTLKVASHPTARTTTVAPQPPTPATSITSRLPPLTRSTQPAPPEGNTDPPPPPAKVPQPPSGKRPGVQGAGAGGRVGIGIGHTVLEATGDSLTIDMVNTSSLMAVLMFGLFFFVVTVIVFLRQAYESFRRKDYTQVDYLINGMYSDSGV